jgi:hypothetical protein
MPATFCRDLRFLEADGSRRRGIAPLAGVPVSARAACFLGALKRGTNGGQRARRKKVVSGGPVRTVASSKADAGLPDTIPLN